MRIERIPNYGGTPYVTPYYAGRLDGFRVVTRKEYGPICKSRIRALLGFICIKFYNGTNW